MLMNDEKTKDLQECVEKLRKGCKTLVEEFEYSEECAKVFPPAIEEDIVKFESTLNFPLPHTYREFLKFSNGAVIDGLEIYALGMTRMPEDYVPDNFLPITSIEGVPERMAISMEDGKIYMFWEGIKEDCDFEYQLMHLLKECELEIKSIKKQKENEKKDPETLKKETEEIVSKWRNFLTERKKENKDK